MTLSNSPAEPVVPSLQVAEPSGIFQWALRLLLWACFAAMVVFGLGLVRLAFL